jgi:hypothetical protein
MTLAYVIPKAAGQPELKSFECRACRETLTEAVEK